MKRLILFFLAAAATNLMADPIVYDINFTTNYGDAPTSGSFSYDPTTETFSDFIVVWDSVTFDLTSSANSPYTNDELCMGNLSGGAAGFTILDGADTCGAQWYIHTPDPIFFSFEDDLGNGVIGTAPNTLGLTGRSGGVFSISAAAAPEPDTDAMMALGLVAAWAARRFRLRARVATKMAVTALTP